MHRKRMEDKPMKYVLFGNTGMRVSRFCLGTMTFGGRHGLDLETSTRVVDEAIDRGVNFIDTADSYGKSEETLGEILTPEKREKVYISTKVFRRHCRDGSVTRNCRTNIISALERSLRNLKTDYVDLYQLHHPDEETPIEETLATLDTLVKQGKTRYVGVSNHYAWQMAYMIGAAQARNLEPIVSVQANYNILDRQIESETVPFCRKFNVAIMCYSPLCNGILSGKYLGCEKPPEGTRGEKMSIMWPYLESEICQGVVKELDKIAREQGLGMNQLAILWLMAKPYATAIILGGSRPEHFAQIYDIAEKELPPDIVEKIDEISAPRIHCEFMNQPRRDGFTLAQQR
ncbi:MAG TPA: aldo/keto reductase [Sumerlaeia bacterium]|nr:aldo/keto reductase [Sumerlaeia bacterium]